MSSPTVWDTQSRVTLLNVLAEAMTENGIPQTLGEGVAAEVSRKTGLQFTAQEIWDEYERLNKKAIREEENETNTVPDEQRQAYLALKNVLSTKKGKAKEPPPSAKEPPPSTKESPIITTTSSSPCIRATVETTQVDPYVIITMPTEDHFNMHIKIFRPSMGNFRVGERRFFYQLSGEED